MDVGALFGLSVLLSFCAFGIVTILYNKGKDSMRRPAALFHITLAVAFTMSQPPPAHADNAKRPPVPPNIQVPAGLEVPAGNRAFREGDAIGTQDYICLPSGWTFFGPQATLFKGVIQGRNADRVASTRFLIFLWGSKTTIGAFDE